MRFVRSGVTVVLVGIVAFALFGCDSEKDESRRYDRRGNGQAAVEAELLAKAFDAATKLPLDPHRKDRARAQQRVVEGCLELGLVSDAKQYASRILNWRRGLCLGKIAVYHAQAGQREAALEMSREALLHAETARDWRGDRIKVVVARAKALLGHSRQANELSVGVEESEAGKLAGVQVGEMNEEEFKERLASIRSQLDPKKFDISRNLLLSVVELHRRNYMREGRRVALEALVKEQGKAMPVFIQMDEHLQPMAETAAKHGDLEHARELVSEIEALFSEYQWKPRHELIRRAEVAKLKAKMGDIDAAAANVHKIRKAYLRDREKIVDIYRAGVLRALAEAYLAVGLYEQAREVYLLALDEGVSNPNSRPRAVDLVDTICSMATAGFAADDAVNARITEICSGLGDPW
jgi:tetratricopeptide (TPR) repeat protein